MIFVNPLTYSVHCLSTLLYFPIACHANPRPGPNQSKLHHILQPFMASNRDQKSFSPSFKTNFKKSPNPSRTNISPWNGDCLRLRMESSVNIDFTGPEKHEADLEIFHIWIWMICESKSYHRPFLIHCQLNKLKRNVGQRWKTSSWSICEF